MNKVIHTFTLTLLGLSLAVIYGFTHGDIEYQHKQSHDEALVSELWPEGR